MNHSTEQAKGGKHEKGLGGFEQELAPTRGGWAEGP